MSTVADLMGLGMPGPLSARIGNTPATLTTTGTTQAAAALIQTSLTLLTTATSTTGAVFSSNASLGRIFMVVNPVGALVTGVVYCPVSGTMNGTTNAGISLTTGKTAMFTQTGALTWVSFPLAP